MDRTTRLAFILIFLHCIHKILKTEPRPSPTPHSSSSADLRKWLPFSSTEKSVYGETEEDSNYIDDAESSEDEEEDIGLYDTELVGGRLSICQSHKTLMRAVASVTGLRNTEAEDLMLALQECEDSPGYISPASFKHFYQVSCIHNILLFL